MSSQIDLNAALQDAWAELERKQTYIQNAFDEAAKLRQELEEAKAVIESYEQNGDPRTSGENKQPVAALRQALQEAWEEIERKQQFLENSFSEIHARNEELEQLRQQLAESLEAKFNVAKELDPKLQLALKKAWEDLDARDQRIIELTALNKAQSERIDWLVLENQTLSNAVGINKLRQ